MDANLIQLNSALGIMCGARREGFHHQGKRSGMYLGLGSNRFDHCLRRSAGNLRSPHNLP